jgi:hypothetical protein
LGTTKLMARLGNAGACAQAMPTPRLAEISSMQKRRVGFMDRLQQWVRGRLFTSPQLAWARFCRARDKGSGVPGGVAQRR